MSEATFEERLAAFEARFDARLNDQQRQHDEHCAKLERERDEYKKLTLLLQEQVERRKLGLLGQKAARLPKNDAQQSLAILNLALYGDGVAAPPEAPEPEQTVPAHQRRKPVRKPLPDTLPRVAFEVLPPEVLSEGLDGFKLVGSETREVLERRPASCVVVAITYKKFIRKDQQRGTATDVLAAPTLELPIDRGLAGLSMLADTIVRRWQDHQPLTRLSDIYRLEQLDLANQRSAHGTSSSRTSPTVGRGDVRRCLWRAVPVCRCHGRTRARQERCRNGHFWVLVAPEKHVLYRYSRRHDGLAVDNLLKGYKGYLVADAHSVYEHLYKEGDVIEVACWAHARRYCYKSLDSDPDRAKVALSHIGALFRISPARASTASSRTATSGICSA